MNFAILDDVLPDMQELTTQTLQRALRSTPICQIGPVVEYAFVQASFPQVLPALTTWHHSLIIEAYLGLIRSGNGHLPTSASPYAQEVEFAWAPSTRQAFANPAWVAFRKRFQDAAQRSGLPKATAQGITGACDEMVSNGFEHSERPDTSIIGYRWDRGEFELVVADRGIGVLESLRQHSDYSDLQDTGTALRTAMTDGESRFGRHGSRGYGFRQVFLSLAQLDGCLRFRSGDQRLEIAGQGPTLAAASIAQAAAYQGLLVSIVCHA